MPIPFELIYRDAADCRISWQEALFETLVIDHEGEVFVPNDHKQKILLKRKKMVLRNYSVTANDDLLKHFIRKIEKTLEKTAIN